MLLETAIANQSRQKRFLLLKKMLQLANRDAEEAVRESPAAPLCPASYTPQSRQAPYSQQPEYYTPPAYTQPTPTYASPPSYSQPDYVSPPPTYTPPPPPAYSSPTTPAYSSPTTPYSIYASWKSASCAVAEKLSNSGNVIEKPELFWHALWPTARSYWAADKTLGGV